MAVGQSLWVRAWAVA